MSTRATCFEQPTEELHATMPMQFPELGAEEEGSGLVDIEGDVFLGVLVALEDVFWPMLLRMLSHLLLG
jgi:hypothetical protein